MGSPEDTVGRAAGPRRATAPPPAHTNRLAEETSPYLLQHAHNPVDWWPWSPEAIERARSEDKLIFLSVGYSTCYWCHVMERESFEDEKTAKLMNERYLNIKVDREERPDVDDIYMKAVQIFTQGHAGWPMSVWIDPHTLRPVFGGTYFPPASRHGLPSFSDVLVQVAKVWGDDREMLEQNGEIVAEAIEQELSAPIPAATLEPGVGLHGAMQLMNMHDPTHGGFGSAPKFPQPVFLQYLLEAREWVDDASKQKIDAALQLTLDRMATGGMYDQVGGGFHRYSTDAKWLVPHFEKMLYDNGALASIYAEAAAVYDDDFYREIVRETLDYVLREMTGEHGAFFSAQDAEVNAREGQNYLWTAKQVEVALSAAGRDDLVDFALHIYGLDQGTNFQDPHHSEEPRNNVLFLIDRPNAAAEELEIEVDALHDRIDVVNHILLEERAKRDQPGLDDKVLVAWNGLMIAGMADGGRVLNEARYIEAAEWAATFILDEMRTEDEGGLLRVYREGQAKVDAFLEDYAMLAWGLLALHEASDDSKWLVAAIDIVNQAHDRFHDEVNGGWFDTLADQDDLFVRSRSVFDGAVPSGNGVMMLVVARLHELSGDERWISMLTDALRGFSGVIARAPVGATLATLAMMKVAERDPSRLPTAAGGVADATGLNGLDGIDVDFEAVRITREGSDIISITLRISDGFHITAHDPGEPSLRGLLVHIAGGEGVIAHAEYPSGEEYRTAGFAAALRAHHGQVTIPVRFEIIGEVSGEPSIAVSWQACTDTACLAPQEVALDVELLVED